MYDIDQLVRPNHFYCYIHFSYTHLLSLLLFFFFFNDTATTEIYTLSLHDALPIYRGAGLWVDRPGSPSAGYFVAVGWGEPCGRGPPLGRVAGRSSTSMIEVAVAVSPETTPTMVTVWPVFTSVIFAVP